MNVNLSIKQRIIDVFIPFIKSQQDYIKHINRAPEESVKEWLYFTYIHFYNKEYVPSQENLKSFKTDLYKLVTSIV